MNIFLISFLAREGVLAVTETVCRELSLRGCGLFAAPYPNEGYTYPASVTIAEEEDACPQCDLIICIGGDGTIIDGAHCSALYGLPVLGINAGRLGFLAQVEPQHIAEALWRILNKDYVAEERFGLSLWQGEELLVPYALNDIVLTKETMTNIIELSICCDDKEMNSYAADGIIISTPTGSTAYSLSAGGPVIDPTLDTVSIVPMCPHSISVRPVVLSAKHTLTVRCRQNSCIIADGRDRIDLAADSEITIRKSQRTARFISLGEYEFFEILSRKLIQRG